MTDPGNKRINIYNSDGIFTKTIDQSIGGVSMSPEGIVFGAENSFYISDQRNNRIIELNEFGVSLSVFGIMGGNDGNFKFPKDVTPVIVKETKDNKHMNRFQPQIFILNNLNLRLN